MCGLQVQNWLEQNCWCDTCSHWYDICNSCELPHASQCGTDYYWGLTYFLKLDHVVWHYQVFPLQLDMIRTENAFSVLTPFILSLLAGGWWCHAGQGYLSFSSETNLLATHKLWLARKTCHIQTANDLFTSSVSELVIFWLRVEKFYIECLFHIWKAKEEFSIPVFLYDVIYTSLSLGWNTVMHYRLTDLLSDYRLTISSWRFCRLRNSS